MNFESIDIEDAFVIDLEKYEDERGFFARTYCAREFQDHGITNELVQANTSLNHFQGTVRGMHYQAEPYGEAKLIRCIRGSIFDVMIDMRTGSPSRLRWFGTELNENNHRMVYIPAGCAHGFMTLKDNTEVIYQVSEFYTPASEKGIRWNDPFFNIDWPGEARIISEKDQSWENFKNK